MTFSSDFLWLYLALGASFLNAIVVLIDKYLLVSPAVGKPAVYAFYVGSLSAAALLLLPFGVVLSPTASIIELSLVIAFSYIFSILFLYKSLKLCDASDVAPAVGAVSAVSTFIFGSLILRSQLPANFTPAFILLVIGTLLMSHLRFARNSTIFVILAGVLFGLSSVFLKMMFVSTTFWNGFFWSRLANVLGAMTLLLWPANVKAVFHNLKSSSFGAKFTVVFNKGLAGFAFLMFLGAVSLGEVSLVNALSGVQFVFLLFFAAIFAKRLPNFIFETAHHGRVVLHKTLATGLIIAGLLILFL